MPNIGALLKQEIVRLSRREVRTQVQATRKSSALYRGHIAALKRQVATLESQVALLERKVLAKPRPTNGDSSTRIRFVAKGLKSQRNRLGLSAADYGRLVGVSAQSIYNWEHGNASPRAGQLSVIATIRGMGKREAQRRLEQIGTKNGAKPRKP